MTDWSVWLIAAGLMVMLEMFSGTFYLLMIGVGLIAAALAAWLGVDFYWQFVIAGIVGAAGSYALRYSKLSQTHKHARGRVQGQTPQAGDVDSMYSSSVHLDIGQTVNVAAWSSSGKARVKYRGADWDVELAADATAQPGVFVICAMQGNRLIVTNR